MQLGLTARSLEVIERWKPRISEAQRVRLDEVLATLQNGMWPGRWWRPPEEKESPAIGDSVQLHPGESLLVLFRIVADFGEEELALSADIATIDVDEEYDHPLGRVE